MTAFTEETVRDEIGAEVGIKRENLDVEYFPEKLRALGKKDWIATYSVVPKHRGGGWYVVRTMNVASDIAADIATFHFGEWLRANAARLPNHNRSWEYEQLLWPTILRLYGKDIRQLYWQEAFSKHHEHVGALAEYDPDKFWQLWQQHVETFPKRTVIPSTQPVSPVVRALAEAMTEEQLRDPLAYLTEQGYRIKNRTEAFEGIMERVAGRMYPAKIARAAVKEKGAAPFLGTADGKVWETPSGFVYWRVLMPR